MRVTPKMIDRPHAARNSDDALAKPVTNWLKKKATAPFRMRLGRELTCYTKAVGACRSSVRRSLRLHVALRRQVFGAVAVAEIHHRALAVLERCLADERAEGGLVVERAEGHGAKRGADIYSLGAGDCI